MTREVACRQCGTMYARDNHHVRFCSDECRKAATKARRAKAFKKWKAKNPEWLKAYHKKRREMDEAKGPEYVAARKARIALSHAENWESQRRSYRRSMNRPGAKERAYERQKIWVAANRAKVNAKSAALMRAKYRLRKLNKLLGIDETTPIHPSVRKKLIK